MTRSNWVRRSAVALTFTAAGLLGACSTYDKSGDDVAAAPQADPALDAVIAARSDEDKARDEWRNPAETLRFFGLEADDTVVEGLPGGGWYTKIILAYVADEGAYAGVNYQPEMYPMLLGEISPERMERINNWPETFPARANEFLGRDDVDVAAFRFGDAPEDMYGKVDVALMIRSLHNLNRLGPDYLDPALADLYALLKPGGVLGIVQHRAPEDVSDESADGSRGYLKQSQVIEALENAGFVFEEASELNANPADKPGESDIVWRLPPTLGMGDKNRDEYIAIGESDRMTLRFRKPAN